MIDTDAAFRAILAANVGVTALVSTRIHDGYIPEGDTVDTREARPVITFDVDPGSPGVDTSLPTSDVDYVVRCWATTALQARSVYKAVYDALAAVNNQTFASVFCYEAYEMKPARTNEDEIGGVYCEAVFRVGFRL